MKYGTLVRLQKAEEAYEKFAKLGKIGLDSCQLVYKPEIYSLDEARQIRAAAEELGIEISDAVAAELRLVGETYGVTADF